MGDEHAEACDWCQASALAASQLRGKRLGTRERRLLLEATPLGQLPLAPIISEGHSQDDKTATRRSVASLRKAKLIWVADETQRITPDQPDLEALLTALHRKYAVLRFASRTELGEAVVQVFGAELRGHGVIRWGVHLDKLTTAVLAFCPQPKSATAA